MKLARWMVALSLVVSTASAFAQEEKVIREEDRTVVRKKTVIDFSDFSVEGELTKPEGTYVLSKKRTRFDSLIKVRDNFQRELQSSADNL